LTNVILFFDAEHFGKVVADDTSDQLVVRKERGREVCRLATAETDGTTGAETNLTRVMEPVS
jgi:hypothetical protein